MSNPSSDKRFVGAVPQLYQEYLVPLIFEPYAVDLTRRLAGRPLHHVLELAAGTGVVTRHLADTLPAHVAITATDLNEPMLMLALEAGTSRPVSWAPADAQQLPFPAGAFDAVVCQFGFMFFPDKARAFAEARRVLKDGGLLLFNVWDRLAENEFAATVTDALAALFPDDPPGFMARTPHGYHDLPTIAADLRAGGFTAPATFETVAARSRAASARGAAVAFCQGTPLRNEIGARDATRLGEATDCAEDALRRRFGPGPIEGRLQAHVVAVTR